MPGLEAFYLKGLAGRLFALWQERGRQETGVAVLHVPAFGDEMNKSRHVVASQARAFATAGLPTLILDLYGTGDSEGSFRDSRWQTWLEDIDAGVQWLRDRGFSEVWLWGLRLGGLLASEFASQRPHDDLGLILWNPVVSGAQFVNQFLRLRSAAAMMRGERESTNALLRRVIDGELLEVAGYELHPELVLSIKQRELSSLKLSALAGIFWFEVGAGGSGPLSPAAERVIRSPAWATCRVVSVPVQGDSFWTTQELAAADDLVCHTAARLRSVGVDSAVHRGCKEV